MSEQPLLLSAPESTQSLDEKKNQNEIQKQAGKLMDRLYPYCSEITIGAVFGYCAGYFSKKMAQKAAYYVGGAFVALQVLQHQGYIKINYHKMQEDAVKGVDADGDGKFTTNDVKILVKKYLAVLGAKLPSSAGFVTAFYLGIRY